MNDAVGGVLFIDEAYDLDPKSSSIGREIAGKSGCPLGIQ